MDHPMDPVHGPPHGAMDRVHGVVHGVVHGGPWTESMGWSMDPGPCFVYVPSMVVQHSITRNTFNLISPSGK